MISVTITNFTPLTNVSRAITVTIHATWDVSAHASILTCGRGACVDNWNTMNNIVRAINARQSVQCISM